MTRSLRLVFLGNDRWSVPSLRALAASEHRVVGGDGQVVSADAAANADVVLQGAQSQRLAQLHGGPSAAEVAAQAQAANAGLIVLTGADNLVAGQMQVAEARAAGFDDVIAGRVGMLVELPLRNNDINVRPL